MDLISSKKPHQTRDFLKIVRGELSNRRTKARGNLKGVAAGVEVNERLIDRFTRSDGPNLMRSLIQGRIAQFRTMEAGLNAEIEHLTTAIDIVDSHTFRADAKPAAAAGARGFYPASAFEALLAASR